MNRFTPIFTIWLALIACALLAPAPQAHAATESANIQIILVEASNGDAGVAPSLRAFGPTLQRLFRFNQYREVNRRNLRVAVPGSSTTALGTGQRIELTAAPLEGRALPLELNWTRGSTRLVHTRIQLNPEHPAVLGGPRSESGATLLLIVQWK